MGRRILHYDGENIDFTQHKELGISNGNKKDDKQTEVSIEAAASTKGTPLFCFSSKKYEMEPEGSVGNVVGRGEE